MCNTLDGVANQLIPLKVKGLYKEKLCEKMEKCGP